MRWTPAVMIWALSLNAALAEETGLDPVSSLSGVNLICGKVDGKFILFSASMKKVWYLFADAPMSKEMRSVRHPSQVEGVEAYTYRLKHGSNLFPTLEGEGGAVIVTYSLPYGENSTRLTVLRDSKGNFRLFLGEDGRNGRCVFL